MFKNEVNIIDLPHGLFGIIITGPSRRDLLTCPFAIYNTRYGLLIITVKNLFQPQILFDRILLKL